MRKNYLLSLLIVCSFYSLSAQTVDDLFQQRNQLSKDYRNVAVKYQALELNTEKMVTIRQQSPATLHLQLPFENGQLNLQLKKVTITSDDFSVTEALPDGTRRTINYSGAVFYQGKIDGVFLCYHQYSQRLVMASLRILKAISS
jgi:hypothetical protein